MRRASNVTGALLLAVGLLAGCGGDSETTGSPTTEPATPAPTGTATTTNTIAPTGRAPQQVAAAVAALRTAARAVPNGRPFDLEQEVEEGQQVWEVKVASNGSQFNLDVSADGSRVLSRVQDQTPDDDVQKLQGVRLDAVQALSTAASRQGGTLSEMEIDTTADGTVIWQVDLRRPDGSVVEVNLDASSGQIVSRKPGE